MIDITRLRELEKKATPRDWQSLYDDIFTVDEIDVDGEGDRYIQIPYDERDADFIAETRNALPGLLDEIETLRAIVKELAESNPYEDEWNTCIFCQADYFFPHDPNCLVHRAREAMK